MVIIMIIGDVAFVENDDEEDNSDDDDCGCGALIG